MGSLLKAFTNWSGSTSRTPAMRLWILLMLFVYLVSVEGLPNKATDTSEETLMNALEDEDMDIAGYMEDIPLEKLNQLEQRERAALDAERVMASPLQKTENMLKHMEETDLLASSAESMHADRVIEEPNTNQEDIPMEQLFAGSSRAANEVGLPESDRVMGGEDQEHPPEEGQVVQSGKGKMNMEVNMEAFEGEPTDLTVGTNAMNIMHQQLRKAKCIDPEDKQVNAVAGFGHSIMEMVNQIKKDTEDRY